MNDFHGILGLQVETLLGALRTQREMRCRQIIREAEKEQGELLRGSRRQLRERVHQAVVEERRRREMALLEARHRIQTAERRKKQAQYSELLQRAWPRLVAEIERRWSDAESRAEWCDMLLAEAVQSLPASSWEIVHGSCWTGDDSARL
ncbi:MAG: hypothetical protein OEY72_10420, partial [Gammaproteobacteria bacterium]|nr:hypothetical protein [Gammaproteobacteria bacterium]